MLLSTVKKIFVGKRNSNISLGSDSAVVDEHRNPREWMRELTNFLYHWIKSQRLLQRSPSDPTDKLETFWTHIEINQNVVCCKDDLGS